MFWLKVGSTVPVLACAVKDTDQLVGDLLVDVEEFTEQDGRRAVVVASSLYSSHRKEG